MSLRTFHLVFMIAVIMLAELFGGWAVREYRNVGDPGTLWLGIASFAAGLGLAGYVLWFVRKADAQHLT